MKAFVNIITICFLSIFIVTYSYGKEWEVNARFEPFEVGDKALGSGGFWGGAGRSEVVESPKLDGKAAKISVKKNETGFGKWGGDWRFPEKLGKGDRVWFSVHTYFPADFDHYSYGEGGRLKFLRISTKSPSGKGEGHNDLYINTKGDYSPYRFIYEGEQRWVNVGKREDLIEKDTWENFQMSITFDSISKDEGGMAEVLIWKNGKRLAHITNRKTLAHDDTVATRALLFTYWNGGAPKAQSMYIDQVTVTTKIPSWEDQEGYPLVPFFTDVCRLPNNL